MTIKINNNTDDIKSINSLDMNELVHKYDYQSVPDKYIYLVDYYNSAIAECGGNEDLFNVELFKAIYGEGKTPAFKNVIDIRVCWNCIPVEEYIDHQESYRRQLLQGFALGDRRNDDFGFDLIMKTENEISRTGIYVLNFVVKTLIPQKINYRSLKEHTYSVRSKNLHYYNQPLCSESALFKLEPVYFTWFGGISDVAKNYSFVSVN